MTEKQILNSIEKLADRDGVDAETYITTLIRDTDAADDEKLKSMPEDLAKQVREAAKIRDDAFAIKQSENEKQKFRLQLADFLKLFPDTPAENIPDEVWYDVANGIPLSYAYAYRMTVKEKAPDAINEENAYRGLPVENDRSEPVAYSEAEVTKMSPAAIKNNFGKIINSMKKWKI